MWYELGKQKFDRQKNFSREMKGIEETMLKYLGKGDIIFLVIPLSTSTRRPGQDNPMSQVSFSRFFVSREQTKNPEGVLSYKRLMGMCAGWGHIFTTGLTIMGQHFQQSYQNGFRHFRKVSKRTRMFVLQVKNGSSHFRMNYLKGS